jgi:peptidoglycan/LPS O-acetylase OafA/YrhL
MSEKLNYIKGLDGTRGFFALLIIINHWTLCFPISPIGWEVLQLFFVLSGFLITRILLNERNKPVYQAEGKFGTFMKGFMTKRAFRIFPLYFAYILIMYVLRFTLSGKSEFIEINTAELETNGIWLWTYLYNLKDIFNHFLGWPIVESRFFAHLWSLGLEEQFYVFFPILIYFIRGRALKITIIAMIVIPFFTRLFGYNYLQSIAEANNYSDSYAIILVFRNLIFQFDSLALGAAIAIFNLDWIKRVHLWFWLIFVAMFAIHWLHFDAIRNTIDLSHVPFDIFISNGQLNLIGYMHVLGHPEYLNVNNQFIYLMPLVNIWCFLLVLSAVRGKIVMAPILEHRFFVYLGKISYGLYVYHFAIILIFLKLLKGVINKNPGDLPYFIQFLLFFVFMAILIFISDMSFRYFESYFLKLKAKMK